MHPFAKHWNADSQLFPRLADEITGFDLVLDVACGDATLVKYLADLGHHVIGVDNVPDFFPEDGNRTHFMLGDAMNLPFEAENFDAVVCVSRLHHARQALVLAEMRRVIKPGGKIVIIGQAKNRSLLDFALAIADGLVWLVNRVGKKAWRQPIANIRPELSWRETRELIQQLLPGASFRRSGTARFIASWQDPSPTE